MSTSVLVLGKQRRKQKTPAPLALVQLVILRGAQEQTTSNKHNVSHRLSPLSAVAHHESRCAVQDDRQRGHRQSSGLPLGSSWQTSEQKPSGKRGPADRGRPEGAAGGQGRAGEPVMAARMPGREGERL